MPGTIELVMEDMIFLRIYEVYYKIGSDYVSRRFLDDYDYALEYAFKLALCNADRELPYSDYGIYLWDDNKRVDISTQYLYSRSTL